MKTQSKSAPWRKGTPRFTTPEQHVTLKLALCAERQYQAVQELLLFPEQASIKQSFPPNSSLCSESSQAV
ncbi:hypothetical protein GRJ2_000184900 [Grus japonensis]|uniref:Uncharacterized protein n=1 Tax=Grus japonensis TaxID=30415 RepID=A0ABC9VWY3_GRUJA